jgi:hypothetical protein
MKKLFLILIFFTTLSFANEFSKMSTQELVAIMGYVKPAKEVQFLRELKKREPFMKADIKSQYRKNLKKFYGK